MKIKEITKDCFDKLSKAGYTYFQNGCGFDLDTENLLAFVHSENNEFHCFRIEKD